jgi:hypothetical protein
MRSPLQPPYHHRLNHITSLLNTASVVVVVVVVAAAAAAVVLDLAAGRLRIEHFCVALTG